MRPPKPWPGDPEAVWAATAAVATAPPRPDPPDVSGFEDFERLAAPPMPGLASAILFAVFGTCMIVYALVMRPFLPAPVEDVGGFFGAVLFVMRWHWIAPLVLGAWCLLSAPRIYRKDRRDHPREVRELYEAARDRGVMCETFQTDFKVLGGEGWYDAVIGVDARLDAVRAARVRRAFEDWFALLEADSKTAHEMRYRHGEREARSAVDFFGPEAEGGYLIRQPHGPGRWTLLVPDPPNSAHRWARLYVDEPAGA